jgi:DNA-directed RNA polymerase alpha subunit
MPVFINERSEFLMKTLLELLEHLANKVCHEHDPTSIKRSDIPVMDWSIEMLGLSIRSYKCLRNIGIKNVHELVEYLYKFKTKIGFVANTRNMTEHCANEIIGKLHKLGVIPKHKYNI